MSNDNIPTPKKRAAPLPSLPQRPPFRRSLSMQDPESPEMDNSALKEQQSTTGSTVLLQRWKRSLKRRIQGSPTTSHIDPDESTTYDVVHLMSFDEPLAMDSDSFENEDTMKVKICKDGIRTSIQEMMKNIGGDSKILEDIENSKNNILSRLKSCSPKEKQIALLWTCFLRRKELLPALVPGADLSFCTEPEGLAALHLAAFSNSPDCLKFLLNAGAEITTSGSLSPLHCAALGNSTDCIKLLLNAGASVNITLKNYIENPTPLDSCLHCAVKANAPDCVALLLNSGADAGIIGEGGLTPLHVAADLGYVDCLKAILKSNQNIDLSAKTQDHRGFSALHLAAEDECAEAVQLLLNFGADPLTRNLRGQSPLHVAAKQQSVECIKILLPKSDVNAGDADRRTALHMAAGRAERAAETMEVLCKAPGVDLNLADRYGHTALHVTALNELPIASAVLIRHGADLTARTKLGATALGLVIRKAPAASYAIEEVLNSAIRISVETNKDRDVELKLDFRPLLIGHRRLEVSLLSIFIAEGQKSLLQHPLCKAFLHLKWQTIRWFYAVRVSLSFLFVAFLSLYALIFLTNICDHSIKPRINQGLEPRITTFGLPNGCINSTDTYLGISQNNSIYTKVTIIVNIGVLLLALLEIIRKVYGFISAFSSPTMPSIPTILKNYFCQMDNILEWFTLISVFLISNLIWKKTYAWQVHLGAFAILAGWANIMIMVGQLPLFGAYVSMYTCVIREFAKLLGAYLCLLVGFAISFCVIFRQAREFSNPLIAFVKVLVMMTGELEFNDLLIDKDTTNSDHAEGKFLDFSAHIIFVIFLLLATLALMNLLVGIAVHDIQGLRASAGLAKLESQAELVRYVETALSGCYSKLFSTRIQCVHNTKQNKSNSTILHIRPHNSLDSRLPREIVKEAYELAKRCNNIYKGRLDFQRRPGRKDSSSTEGEFYIQPKPREHRSDKLGRHNKMRRTVYVKLDENVQDETSMEIDSETLAAVKQLAEDNQVALAEMKDAIAETNLMLRELLNDRAHALAIPHIRNE